MPQYRLELMWRAKAEARRLTRLALRLGMLESFRDAVRSAERQMTTRPRRWGDPLYRFHRLDLIHYRGNATTFYAYYSVDRANRIVYWRDIVAAPGSPLGTP